jgi:hypothetical protein
MIVRKFSMELTIQLQSHLLSFSLAFVLSPGENWGGGNCFLMERKVFFILTVFPPRLIQLTLGYTVITIFDNLL